MPLQVSLRRFSFLGKMFSLVVAVVVLVVGFTAWFVNHQFTNRYHDEIQNMLMASDIVFNHARETSLSFARSWSEQAAHSPQIRALTRADLETVEDAFQTDLLDDLGWHAGVDAILFSNELGSFLAGAFKDPDLPSPGIQSDVHSVVQRALTTGQSEIATRLLAKRLFDLVSVPIAIERRIVGFLSFVIEVGDRTALELKRLTGCEIVILANGDVVACTLADCPSSRRLTEVAASSIGGSNQYSPRAIRLENGIFHGIAGRLRETAAESDVNYLLLRSSETALRDLRAMQRSLVISGVVGIVLSCLIAGLVFRRITEPLRQLRSGAEAVGRGDLSCQLPIHSQDEFGDLASSFNRMTASLKASRMELEEAVERLKETQAQLVQSEKLAGIGQFVAGIAHELNNPLTSVLCYADMLNESPMSESHKKSLSQVVFNADRCAKIVRNLLSFARQSKPQRGEVDLHRLLESTLQLFEYPLRTSSIQIVREWASGLPPIMADSSQLQQVFFNVINNARQALEHKESGAVLRIATAHTGERIEVAFEDNGPGISDKELAKLFTPFHTTKEIGKGTGLGLSVSYGIIKEHGGDIRVDSRLGSGATFIVEFPISCSIKGDSPQREPNQIEIDSRLNGRGQRVLVIDDESCIIDLVQMILSPLGFRIIAAKDYSEALDALRREQIDAVLCDLRMPGVGGEMVLQEIRASHPQLASRFMYMTGDILCAEIQKDDQTRNELCLPKPFSASELQAAIRTLLDVPIQR